MWVCDINLVYVYSWNPDTVTHPIRLDLWTLFKSFHMSYVIGFCWGRSHHPINRFINNDARRARCGQEPFRSASLALAIAMSVQNLKAYFKARLVSWTIYFLLPKTFWPFVMCLISFLSLRVRLINDHWLMIDHTYSEVICDTFGDAETLEKYFSGLLGYCADYGTEWSFTSVSWQYITIT